MEPILKVLISNFQHIVILLGFVLITTGCKDNSTKQNEVETTREIETKTQEISTKTEKKVILCFGNSLTAGYGLDDERTWWTSLLQERIDSLDLEYSVVNAGLSGETTSEGTQRIGWVLNQSVDIFILELGANDMLRGLAAENTKNNLSAEQKAALADFPTLYYMEEKKRVTYYLIDDFGIYLASEAPALQPVVSLYKQLATKGIYTFENVNFASGKWNLQPAAFTELDDLTAFLKENPTKKIEIGGHTDSQGTVVSNQQLSENRAKAVYNYLIEKGIDAERLNFKGYGETKPKMTNKTEAGRLENRRVECVIL